MLLSSLLAIRGSGDSERTEGDTCNESSDASWIPSFVEAAINKNI